jgi:hypothetical protein
MLMITVTIIGFLPVLALPVLRRTEQLQAIPKTT